METQSDESAEKQAWAEAEVKRIKLLSAQVERRCVILRERTTALYENNKLLAKNNKVLENRLNALDDLINMVLESGRGYDE